MGRLLGRTGRINLPTQLTLTQPPLVDGTVRVRRNESGGSLKTIISKSGEVPLGAQVLVSGTVSILPEGEGEPNPYVVSQPGTVLGTMALIVERPRGVTVTAISIVETLFVPRHAFLKLANQSPALAARAAKRIRQDLGSFVGAIAPVSSRIKKS